MSMKKRLLIFLIVIVCLAGETYGRPQYSILQSFGTKCQSCHVNIQGGGLRNNNGFISRKDISIIDPKSIGLGGFFDVIGQTNTQFNDMVTYGVDFRLQSARWPNKTTTTNILATKRESMVMQTTPALSIKPVEWLQLDGFYNFAYLIESDKRYLGQDSYSASLYFKPSEKLPALRVGYFQPTIGTKYDDHTYFTRQVTTQYARFPLIPDDYAEWGAQIDYESLNWLGLSIGAFSSKNLSLLPPVKTKSGGIEPIVNSNEPDFVFRANFYPNIKGWNTFFGGYYLVNSGGTVNSNHQFNNYFYIADLFWHIGIADKFAVMLEGVRSYKHLSRSTNNFTVELDYQLLEAWNAYVRGERGNTEDKIAGMVFHNNQVVIGTHLFPIPFIDLLIEYRIYEAEAVPSTSNQFAVQLHVFY
jgi:hypothetical protein